MFDGKTRINYEVLRMFWGIRLFLDKPILFSPRSNMSIGSWWVQARNHSLGLSMDITCGNNRNKLGYTVTPITMVLHTYVWLYIIIYPLIAELLFQVPLYSMAYRNDPCFSKSLSCQITRVHTNRVLVWHFQRSAIQKVSMLVLGWSILSSPMIPWHVPIRFGCVWKSGIPVYQHTLIQYHSMANPMI